MNNIESILNILKEYQILGLKQTENGATLIGHAPHIAPNAWLHKLYKPLLDEEIKYIEEEIKIKLPRCFSDFLKITNGLNIFVGKFAIYGLRKSVERSGDNVWQPFSIITPNTIERIRNANPDHLFIGGYSFDGSLLYLDKEGKAFRCIRGDATPINSWHSFEDMLSSEINRMIKLFTKEGKIIDENTPTIPS